MSRNSIFLITVLLTMFFWQWAYFEFKGHYSGLSEAQHEINSLHEKITQEKVKIETVQYQFDLFKQQVAVKIPQVLDRLDPMRQKEGRSIASVLQKPNDEFLTLAQFDSEIEEMKSLFEKKKYQSVIRKGKILLEQNPISLSIVSVYFMLAESYFQLNEFDACFGISEEMVRLFPDNAKTGYVLLRVGMFLQEKNRIAEAKSIFSLVNTAFKSEKTLRFQSEKLLSSLTNETESKE